MLIVPANLLFAKNFKFTEKCRLDIDPQDSPNLQNVFNREKCSLNGKWNILIDQSNLGMRKHYGNIPLPKDKTDFVSESFGGGKQLTVPGDWNSQDPELKYYEGNVWYERKFYVKNIADHMLLRFGAVSQNCTVFVNGKQLGTHHGPYTPFQFEVTSVLKKGENEVVVRVDNIKTTKSIPSIIFGWENYGGITRDVCLIRLPKTYINDYFIHIQPDKTGEFNKLSVAVSLKGEDISNQEIKVTLDNNFSAISLKTNKQGRASKIVTIKNPKLWTPEFPYRYKVKLVSEYDDVTDNIGLRTIFKKDGKIFLNGTPIFLRGVNFHEEIASEARRACTPQDAAFLTGKAKELGCNFVRLAHYSQNEYILDECDKKGLLVWEEIPAWQGITFSDPDVQKLAKSMFNEMFNRDKNRGCIIIWSIANETRSSAKNRNNFLISFIDRVHSIDNTRLVAAAFGHLHQDPENKFLYGSVDKDPLIPYLDVVGINSYNGWYKPWPGDPSKIRWELSEGLPLIVSEFGAGGIYGNHQDQDDVNGWSEDYMGDTYRKDLIMIEQLPNLCGIAPWALFDFRNPGYSQARYQQGWNRKGLISQYGEKKQAWYIMHEFYEQVKNNKNKFHY